ncbi:MAG: hypothetical protein RIR26_785 [Pseudomonadota bacterium]|jgi:HEAT repeat protein
MSATPTAESKASSSDAFSHLSSQIHSYCETESHMALDHLAQNKSNDSARALIEAYRDCHWRDTRISILRALGKNGSERAIDFLLHTCLATEDIGITQETFLALGETSDPVAATFLLQQLDSVPVYLKPWVVSALARIPDLRAAGTLRELLKSKECNEHPQLLRNCVVALSEMKDTRLLPDLIAMLRNKTTNAGHAPDSTSLTLLAAISKLSRQTSDLAPFERVFESEMLHAQFFQQCKTQVSFREQWTLEDYLGKLFFGENMHRALPLELNSFPSADLNAALSLFASEAKHFPRLCEILASLLDADEHYTAFITVSSLTREQIPLVLSSLALHRTDFSRQLCLNIFETHLKAQVHSEASTPAIAAWLRTLICIEKDPLNKILNLLSSEKEELPWHERNRTELINAFVSCALAVRKSGAWPKKTLQTIHDLIHAEASPTVLGRWLRALGELGLSAMGWSDDLHKKVIQSPSLQASALLMLEREDEHQNTALLRAIQPTLVDRPEQTGLFLRACARLKNSEKDIPTDALLQTPLTTDKSDDTMAALTYLSAHPRLQLLESVLQLCQPEHKSIRVVTAAIVTLRSYKNERSIPALTACLASSSKILSGRALDTLLAIDHPAARHSVVSFFVKHLADAQVTDKVLRSLKAPQQGDPSTASLLEDAMNHVGDLSLKDDILELASRLRSGSHESVPANLPGTEVIRALDKQLESKIAEYAKLADPVKACLRSAELPLNQPDLFEGTVDKSSSVVQYCKALDLALEKDFGQRILFPKMEQQLHVFQNLLHKAELDQESPNINLVMHHLRAEHVFDLNTFPASKMMMVARSVLSGRILRERAQVIDGLKAWAVLILLFSGHERLWGAAQMKSDPLLYTRLAHKLVALQDLRNPAAHRQTMLALAPLSEIRKEVFHVFSIMKKAFE